MSDTATNRKDALLQDLQRRILTQDLTPGADLDEAGLSAQFGLSRTPLREVLRELAGEGYVTLTPNRGARVAELSHTTLRDFFLAAPMIYSAVLRLAATHARADQIEVLRAAQADFRTALKGGDVSARALANNRFHAITGDMAGNLYLRPSFNRLLIDHARISMTFYDEAQGAETGQAADHHDAMIDAIVARDAEAAAQLAEDHWALSRDRIAQFVMPAALTVPLGDLSNLTRTP